MKRTTQVIVLLDVMFIFLFILIIKPPKQGLTLKIDNEISISYTMVLAIHNRDKNILVLEKNNWIKKNITKDNLIYQSFLKEGYFLIERELTNLPEINKNSYKIYTLIYGKLYSNIAKQTMMQCMVFNKCGNNPTIHIQKNGRFQIIKK